MVLPHLGAPRARPAANRTRARTTPSGDRRIIRDVRKRRHHTAHAGPKPAAHTVVFVVWDGDARGGGDDARGVEVAVEEVLFAIAFAPADEEECEEDEREERGYACLGAR